MELLVDSPQARSVRQRLQRAIRSLQELQQQVGTPQSALALAQYNVSRLRAEYVLLPRRRAA